METLTKSQIKTECYHCGEDCLGEAVLYNNKPFCCSGCETVYRILKENDLDAYYDIESTPGTKNSDSTHPQTLEILDKDEIRSQLILFSGNGQTKVAFQIPAIHCSSCIYLLENLYRIHPAVLSSTVNFPQKKVTIFFNEEELSLSGLAQLLKKIGYEPDIQLDQKEKTAKTNAFDKKLIAKIGIAGFCFGNIMLLSMPEYLSHRFDLPANYQALFSYLIVALTLPVLGYSAQDYFKSAIHSLKQKWLSIDVPIALGISVLFLRSLWEIFYLGQAGYLDSLAGLVFFLLIGKWFQGKTYAMLSFDRDYKSFFPLSTLKKDEDNGLGEKYSSTLLKDLSVGDIIKVRNNEVIPADGILLNNETSIDYSFVTGESLPEHKQAGDQLFAGGRLTNKSAEIMITKTVDQSYFTQLWNNPAFDKKSENGISTMLDKVSHYFTITIVIIAIAALIVWSFVSSFHEAISVFTAVLIVACPCALALSAPFTYGHATRIFGRNKFYLKNSRVVEQLANTEALVFDKTGTLTKTDEAYISYDGEALNNHDHSLVHSAVYQSIHPLSIMLNDYLAAFEMGVVEEFRDISGKGISAIVDGHEIILGSRKWIEENGGAIDSKPDTINQTRVYIMIDGRYKGFFLFENEYREDILPQLRSLSANYSISVLSGDNDSERMKLETALGEKAELKFNQDPTDKLAYIKQQQQRAKTTMVGDGLNDAGALQQSNVGIAITENVNQFSPGCDAILDAAALPGLTSYLSFARSAKGVLKSSMVFSFAYNIIGLGFAISGFLTPLVAAILMPLSSISVVAFVSLVTNLKARKFNL